MTQPPLGIGDLAARTGLSMHTIRCYEGHGLITPAGDDADPQAPYADRDLARLRLIKYMKPLGMSVEEMRDLLALQEALDTPRTGLTLPERTALFDRWHQHLSAAEERCARLRTELRAAEAFAGELRRDAAHHRWMERRR